MKIGKRVKHHPNLGNYESIEFEAWVELDVPDDASVAQYLQQISEELDDHLQGDLEKVSTMTSNTDTYVDELVDRPRRHRKSRRG